MFDVGDCIYAKLKSNKINAKTFKKLLLIFFSIAALKMIIQSLIEFNVFF